MLHLQACGTARQSHNPKGFATKIAEIKETNRPRTVFSVDSVPSCGETLFGATQTRCGSASHKKNLLRGFLCAVLISQLFSDHPHDT